MRGLILDPWRAIRRFSARVPLRVKLITAVLTLVAIALAVISAASIAVFRGYLLHRADQQLRGYVRASAVSVWPSGPSSVTIRSARPPCTSRCLQRVAHAVPGAPRLGFNSPGPLAYMPPPSQFIVEILDRNGRPLGPVALGLNARHLPAVPTGERWISVHAGRLVTVPAVAGGGSWRVIPRPIHYTASRIPLVGAIYPAISVTSTRVPGQAGTYLVGIDLGSIDRTIGTLTLIDLAVSGIVIVILAGVGITVVRRSLRPFAEIEQTAGAIAAGDLSRRVPEWDPRTEVGRLGRSLNMMLGQIEQAFRARSVSEVTARESEERMRRFIADASHELRTPLSVIRGFAEYYRQRGGLKEAELDRMVVRIENEATRMGLLVQDLLLLARLDQQRPLQRRLVDILALAADAAADARVLAPRRDIGLTVATDGPFLVLGDEARLRQVIGNLVSNALNHTPDGTAVELGLSAGTLGTADNVAGKPGPADQFIRAPGPADQATRAGGGGSAVVLEVADSGPGLTAQQAERVFERFYRADAARTRTSGGTGLGLAIVAALTAAHGGAASVSSTPGKGATFKITLPLAPDAATVRDALDPSPDTLDDIPAGTAYGPHVGPADDTPADAADGTPAHCRAAAEAPQSTAPDGTPDGAPGGSPPPDTVCFGR